jgi:hypothetical protein
MPTISAETEGVSRRLILDMGSNISILQPGISKNNIQVTKREPYGVTADVLNVKEQQSVTVLLLNGSEFTHSFLVCSLPTQTAGLLGSNLLGRIGAHIDFESGQLAFSDVNESPCVCNAVSSEHIAHTVFSEAKSSRSHRQEKTEETRRLDEQFPADSPLESIARDEGNQAAGSWITKANSKVAIPTNYQRMIANGTFSVDIKASRKIRVFG